MADIIQTSNNIKQMFRDKMRHYFRAHSSMKLQYLRDVVLMLMNNKDINNLSDALSEKEYALTKKALQDYDKLYSYANLVQDAIIKLDEKHDSERMKMKIDHENRRLMEIAASLPPTNFRIMRAFYLLVNNCDLRNVSVPKDDKFDNRGKMGFLAAPDTSGGGNF